MKWKALFDYLEEKVNFRYVGKKSVENITWDCDHKLTHTKQFCKDNNIDFRKVEALCCATGGYCDCEVLFNTTERISDDDEL